IQIRHPQRAVETRREGAAGHHTNLALAHKKLVTLAGHAAPILGANSNQAPPKTVALFGTERRGADKLAPEFHERIESRLQRRGRAVKLVTVKRQSRFHPERVARAKPARHHPARRTGFENRAEKRLSGGRGGKELEAVLAGIASARDDASGARDLRLDHSEAPHPGQRH